MRPPRREAHSNLSFRRCTVGGKDLHRHKFLQVLLSNKLMSNGLGNAHARGASSSLAAKLWPSLYRYCRQAVELVDGSICTAYIHTEGQATCGRGTTAGICGRRPVTTALTRHEFIRTFQRLVPDREVSSMASHLRLPRTFIIACFLAAITSGPYLRAACGPSAPSPANEPTAPIHGVGIQLGLQPPELERYAADELARYVHRLFDVEVTRSGAPSPPADALLLVGTPETNPAVSQAVGSGNWPQVSDQGIVLKPASLDGKPVLVIGGGSPAATLWAVYELVERWGVRYLLSGDVYPERRTEFCLPAIDLVLEPEFRARWFKTMGDFPMGMEGWGLADYRPFLDQLAKLKFNRIRVGSSPSQPFLDLRVQGIQQQSAVLWYGYRYPITDDMPGRKLFGNEAEFWNPDLPPPPAAGAEILAAGQRHCHALIAYAHCRGIEASFVGSITDFPEGVQFAGPRGAGRESTGTVDGWTRRFRSPRQRSLNAAFGGRDPHHRRYVR